MKFKKTGAEQTTITRDVKENSLSIERSEQEEIENYKRKK